MQTDLNAPLRRLASRRSSSGDSSRASQRGSIQFPTGRNVDEDLDYLPKLSFQEKVATSTFSLAVCAALFAITAPRKMNIPYGLGLCFIFLGCLGVMRLVLTEAYYKTKQRGEDELRDEDSQFFDEESIHVHYKSASPSVETPSKGVHLYHGFGANVDSWRDVQGPLSEALGACVTSHDTPAFGLTNRPLSLKKYSLAYSGQLGRKVCKSEMKKIRRTRQPPSGDQSPQLLGAAPNSVETSDAGDQVYLVGHSMGTLCAAYEAVNNPEDIAGVIFVSPAIFAPRKKARRKSESSGSSSGPDQEKPGKGLWRSLTGVLRVLMASLVVAGSRLGLWLVQPALVLSLRWAVRSKQFWEKGLRSAFFHKDLVGKRVINSYRLPQLVLGWEWGIIRFVRARLTGSHRTIVQRIKDAWNQKQPPGLVQQLVDVVDRYGFPVLIIHGEEDMLVPCLNSENLADVIPNSTLISYPNCGHVPHEEMPHRFVKDVEQWVNG